MSDSRRWWALSALVLCVLTIGFDATIVNVALPTLATAIHASNSDLQWIADAYVLVFAGLLLPVGAIGDRYGRKRLLLIGLALFAVASLAATLATTAGWLIVARAVLGVAAAILTPITLAVLPILFTPDERPRALAIAMMAAGVGVPLGPLVGGLLLEHFWWGSIFLVNVPVATVALVAVALLVPESSDPLPRPVDWIGAALSTLGIVGVVYAVIEAPSRGWSDPLVWATLAGGVGVLAAFVLWLRRAAGASNAAPVIDLRLFADRRFLFGSLAATVSSFALFGLLFVLPQYLQVVRGNTSFGTGLRLIPMMIGLIVGARGGESMARRWGAKAAVAVGLAMISIGLAVGATTSITSGYGFVAAWLVLLGIGTGTALTPAMDSVLGALPAARVGSGTALTMTFRQVGGALGVAVLGSVLAGAYTDHLHLPAGTPSTAVATANESVAAARAVATATRDAAIARAGDLAYLGAMGRVLLVCAVIALVGAVGSAIGLPARAQSGVPAEELRHEPADIT
jgi:EmrB/QacA subfamily drug resistance transporter